MPEDIEAQVAAARECYEHERGARDGRLYAEELTELLRSTPCKALVRELVDDLERCGLAWKDEYRSDSVWASAVEKHSAARNRLLRLLGVEE